MSPFLILEKNKLKLSNTSIIIPSTNCDSKIIVIEVQPIRHSDKGTFAKVSVFDLTIFFTVSTLEIGIL